MNENEKRKSKKRIAISAIKVISFILVFVLLLEGLSLTVFSKSSATKYKNKFQNAYAYANEVKNSIDIVGLGNSNLYSALCPVKLWDKRGYTSTIVASPRQTVSMTYTMLSEVLKTQSPKFVILEAEMFYEGVDLDLDFDKKDAPKKRLPVIPYVTDDQFTTDIENHFTIFLLHDSWKKVSLRSKKDEGSPNNKETIYNHGFYFNKAIKKVSPNDNMKYTDAAEAIPEETMLYLNKIIALCEKNDIQLMFINVPSLTTWSYARHNAVAEFSKENDIPYLDFNTLEDFEINYQKDFRDKGNHMNYYGAKKITNYIGKYINKNYADIIDDKRKNDDYSYWYDDKEAFIQNHGIKVF